MNPPLGLRWSRVQLSLDLSILMILLLGGCQSPVATQSQPSAPLLTIIASKTSVLGQKCQFDSKLRDSTQPGLRYIWTFPDSTFRINDETWTSRYFENPGEVIYSLQIFDVISNKLIAEASDTITIILQSSTINPQLLAGLPNVPYQFVVKHGTFTGIKNLTYNWSFGDNSQPTTLQNTDTVTHVFRNTGLYTVTVTILGDSKTLVTRAFSLVNIYSIGSGITATPKIGVAQKPVLFTAPLNGGSVANHHFTWQIGSTSTPIVRAQVDTLSYTFAKAGSYPVSVSISNDSSGIVELEEHMLMSVAPIDPASVSITPNPLNGMPFTNYTFKAIHPPLDPTHGYNWIWTFDASGVKYQVQNQDSIVHSFYGSGNYLVTLSIIDDSTGLPIANASSSAAIAPNLKGFTPAFLRTMKRVSATFIADNRDSIGNHSSNNFNSGCDLSVSGNNWTINVQQTGAALLPWIGSRVTIADSASTSTSSGIQGQIPYSSSSSSSRSQISATISTDGLTCLSCSSSTSSGQAHIYRSIEAGYEFSDTYSESLAESFAFTSLTLQSFTDSSATYAVSGPAALSHLTEASYSASCSDETLRGSGHCWNADSYAGTNWNSSTTTPQLLVIFHQ